MESIKFHICYLEMKKKKKKDLGSLGYYLSSRLTIARVIIPGRGQNQRTDNKNYATSRNDARIQL